MQLTITIVSFPISASRAGYNSSGTWHGKDLKGWCLNRRCGEIKPSQLFWYISVWTYNFTFHGCIISLFFLQPKTVHQSILRLLGKSMSFLFQPNLPLKYPLNYKSLDILLMVQKSQTTIRDVYLNPCLFMGKRWQKLPTSTGEHRICEPSTVTAKKNTWKLTKLLPMRTPRSLTQSNFQGFQQNGLRLRKPHQKGPFVTWLKRTETRVVSLLTLV